MAGSERLVKINDPTLRKRAMILTYTLFYALENSSIISDTCSKFCARYAFVPQNINPWSIFPFTALTNASVIQ